MHSQFFGEGHLGQLEAMAKLTEIYAFHSNSRWYSRARWVCQGLYSVGIALGCSEPFTPGLAECRYQLAVRHGVLPWLNTHLPSAHADQAAAQ